MKNTLKEVGDRVADTSRKVYLAGLGTVATAGEKATGLFNGLVEKGREQRGDEPSRSTKAAQAVQGKVDAWRKQVETRVQSGVAGALNVFNVPSRNEIKDLSASVERLTTKVQALQS